MVGFRFTWAYHMVFFGFLPFCFGFGGLEFWLVFVLLEHIRWFSSIWVWRSGVLIGFRLTRASDGSCFLSFCFGFGGLGFWLVFVLLEHIRWFFYSLGLEVWGFGWFSFYLNISDCLFYGLGLQVWVLVGFKQVLVLFFHYWHLLFLLFWCCCFFGGGEISFSLFFSIWVLVFSSILVLVVWRFSSILVRRFEFRVCFFAA